MSRTWLLDDVTRWEPSIRHLTEILQRERVLLDLHLLRRGRRSRTSAAATSFSIRVLLQSRAGSSHDGLRRDVVLLRWVLHAVGCFLELHLHGGLKLDVLLSGSGGRGGGRGLWRLLLDGGLREVG